MKNKIVTLCLAVLLAFITLSVCACGNKNINTPDHLEIKIYEAGYGTAGISAVADKFMELNEGKTIKITSNTDGAVLRTELPAGPSTNTTDMYFAGSFFYDLLTLGEFKTGGVTYKNRFLPLDDVYNNPATGETVLIKDKMTDEYEQYFYCDEEFKSKYNLDSSYYMSPWVSGLNGFVYNGKMFEKYGWEIPVTTDELVSLSDEILATEAVSTNKNSVGQKIKISPFIFCKADSYWEYVYIEWWAQYDGVDTFNKFFEGKNKNGEHKPDLVASDGMRETLRIMNQLLGTYTAEASDGGVLRSNIYCDPSLTTRTFIDVQATLLNAEGARKNDLGATTAAMMPNGDWIENEMYNNYGAQLESGEIEFKMMKTPIVSAITNKLSFNGDENLSTLVKWIDGGKQGEKPSFASDDDVLTVETARGISSSGGGISHCVLVPAYSSSPDLAKDFLRYLYSDEGIKIYTKAGRGISLPFDFDYSQAEEISNFQKTKFDILAKTKSNILRSQKYPISYRAGLKPFTNIANMGSVESMFNVSSITDYKSNDTVFQLNYQEIARVWQRMMEDAGLN